MHSRFHNRAILKLGILPRGPLLVRAGELRTDSALPIEHNVLMPNDGALEEPYIPGSTLKGVIRTHVERIAVSCGMKVCDPFSSTSCGRLLGAEGEGSRSEGRIYSEVLCSACKLFGCAAAAGRFWVRDAVPSASSPIARQLRSALAIDRFLGSGRPGSSSDHEAVVQGRFETQIMLENFELWQLAMIGIALMDLDEGFAQIGGLKSKGYGLVSITFDRCELFYAKPGLPADRAYGIGSLVSERTRREFGYMAEDWVLLRRPTGPREAMSEQPMAELDYDVVMDVFGLEYVLTKPDAVRSFLSMLPRLLLDYVSRQRTASERQDTPKTFE